MSIRSYLKSISVKEYNTIKDYNKEELNELKKKLESYFKFDIVDYIVSDILDCETYNHVCLMINLAIVNNRLSLKNGKILKNKLKKLFNIKDIFDKFYKDNYMVN
ncbi:MAG: hypothetical protein KIC54_01535 [Clostridium sp.]|nr:hypothetical protein [Clostridium sp.]